MPKGILFWVIFVLWVILGIGGGWPRGGEGWRTWGAFGGGLVLAILLFLVGWQVFGFVVQ
jgi:hypothetical protein